MLAMRLEPTAESRGIGFDDLYRSSRDDVYAYVSTLLRDRGAAEDVTATAFERAYRKRNTFMARRGSPRAWLFGIARNAALDELRRRQRTAQLDVDVHEIQVEGGRRAARSTPFAARPSVRRSRASRHASAI